MEKFYLKIENEIVECKPFTLKKYSDYLIAKTVDDSTPIKNWMNDVLATCTNLETDKRHIAQYIIINLMYKSLNQHDIFQEYVCECGHEFDVKIDPSKISIKTDNLIDELYDLKSFKISLKHPKLFADDDLSSMIVDCIDSIYVGDDVIKIDDLSDYELNDLFNAITTDDMDKLKDILLEPELQLNVPIVCPKCGKAHVHSIVGFNEFIRILQ